MKSLVWIIALLALAGCQSPTSTSSKSSSFSGLVGVVTTLAGSTTSGSADGTGTAATFNVPMGTTTDGTNLYVADMINNRIRKIVIATGVVTTVAGSTTSGSADGTGTAATFSDPQGVTTDGTNLYVADTNNGLIRKIVIATGVVTTLAGSTNGYADGTGTAAAFYAPIGITTDGTNLYVGDTDNCMIRKVVIATGVVTTLAGAPIPTSGHADGTGAAATFNAPMGITTDGTNLFVADQSNQMIRKIVIATGVVTTLAGSTTQGYTDGTGTAATFDDPVGLATDSVNLYVADAGNCMIRKIVIATGVVTTLAGSTTIGSADGTGAAAGFNQPWGVAVSSHDPSRLFVADTVNNTIRMIR